MNLPVRNSPLSKSFFRSPTLEIARNLIGKGLLVLHRKKPLLVEIVEVEAYLESTDPASHSHRGITKRNWPMFESAGTCYVYLSYGVNYCMNVVTGKKGVGEAVLIRAGRPLSGIEQMFKNRGIEFNPLEKAVRNLCNGPGKLTKALGINLQQNGALFSSKQLQLVDLRKEKKSIKVVETPRIGISKATELPFRFVLEDSAYLSRPQRIRCPTTFQTR